MNQYLKVVLAVAIVIIAGVFLLYALGGSLISEVTKEVVIEERGQIAAAGIGPPAGEAGKPAPFFELPDLAGHKTKVTDFLGTQLVLTFWTTWNGNSTDQIKIFDDYLRKDTRNLFKIIAISSQEDKSAVANFVNRGGYKVQILLDETGSASEKYQARNLPVTYFIDKDGVLRDIFVGILLEKTVVDKIEQLLR